MLTFRVGEGFPGQGTPTRALLRTSAVGDQRHSALDAPGEAQGPQHSPPDSTPHSTRWLLLRPVQP